MLFAVTDFRLPYLLLGVLAIIGSALFWVRARSKQIPSEVLSRTKLPNGALAVGFGLLVIYFASRFVRLMDWSWIGDVEWQVVDRWMHAGFVAALFMLIYWAYLEWIGERQRGQAEPTANLTLLRKLGTAAILALGFVSVLQVLGIEVGPVLASLGIVGVAMALALQETLGNYFAGISLGADRPYGVGEYIVVGDGVRGTLDQIGWRSARIIADDGSRITIPNSKLLNSVVTMLPNGSRSEAIVNGCVAYEANLQTLETLLVEIGKQVRSSVDGADQSAEPEVRYIGFADSNMQFRVKMVAMDAAAASLMSHEFTKGMHQKFFELGIPVSYPVRQVVNVPPPEPQASEPQPSRDVI